MDATSLFLLGIVAVLVILAYVGDRRGWGSTSESFMGRWEHRDK